MRTPTRIRATLTALVAGAVAFLPVACGRSPEAESPPDPAPAPVVVMVVAPLEPLIQTAVERYAPDRQRYGFTIIPGSSQSIAQQTRNGAIADLIISANPDSLQSLDPAPSSVRPWIVNRLVVITADPDIDMEDFDYGGASVVIADDTTDLGLHTRLAMRQREIWSDARGRIRRVNSAEDVVGLVSQGEADLGVVNATAVAGAEELRILGDLELPDSVELEYVLAPFSDNGRRLADWLSGPEGAELARSLGYELVEGRQ